MKRLMKYSAVALALMLFIGGATFVSARNIAEYDVVMPRFGGATYTDTLTKTNQSRAVNNNGYIGGGYKMNCAVYWGSDKITEDYSLTSGSRILIPYNEAYNFVDSNVKLGMWTGLTTYVKVAASGSWSPDEN